MLNEEQKRKVNEGLNLLIMDLLFEAEEQIRLGENSKADKLKEDAQKLYDIGKQRGYISLPEFVSLFGLCGLHNLELYEPLRCPRSVG